MGHFGVSPPSQSLGIMILKKQNLTQQNQSCTTKHKML